MTNNSNYTPNHDAPLSLRAAYVVQTIKDAYTVLKQEEDLSPRNPRINDVLGKLVRTLSEDYTPEEEARVLNHRDIKAIRAPMHALLAKAEGAMEKFWEEEFSKKSEITQDDMQSFWYWQNYQDLVRGEAKHLPQHSFQKDDSICFVGAGPLPLTAVILHQQTGQKVTCVDNDPGACACAKDFIRKAGLQEHIDVVCANGADHDFSKHPVTIIASLVPEKEKVFRRISETCAHDVFFGVRSAEHLHMILYPPVREDSDELGQCSRTGETAYDPKIINTTLFYHSTPGWHTRLNNKRTAAASSPATPQLH